MKKILVALAIPALMTAVPGFAADAKTNWKQGATVITTTLVGAAIAGPFGLFAGAVSGGWLGEHIERADQLGGVNTELEQSVAQIERDQQRIQRLETDLDALNEALASRLEFQVLFATGQDEFQDLDAQRLQMLAGYLLRNRDLQVQLDGYADPRGTDEYNNVLAMYRAQNVAEALNAMGVPKSRIEVRHHGASGIAADAGLDAFALQRRVDIKVYQPEHSQLAGDSQSAAIAGP